MFDPVLSAGQTECSLMRQAGPSGATATFSDPLGQKMWAFKVVHLPCQL